MAFGKIKEKFGVRSAEFEVNTLTGIRYLVSGIIFT